MLRIEDALAIVLERTVPQPAIRLGLAASIGTVLREETTADLDLPPFDRARMDGYALIGADTTGATPDHPVRLVGIGEVAAGECFEKEVRPGQAVRIMTGAPVPAGADTVERIEVIEVVQDEGREFIRLREPVAAQKNITPRGFEVPSGARILAPGQWITPAMTAVLATFGYATVAASSRPRVAVISTGSELVDVATAPGPGQIRDSNRYSLAGYVQASGGEVVTGEVVADDLAATVHTIEEALATAEVVLLTGGVSMGDYDLVKPALHQLGATIHFERVAMHPGKPTVFATLGDRLIFGLPGNPVSVAVAFYLFVRPALMKMQGAATVELPRSRVFCHHALKGAPPRRSHQPGRLLVRDGEAVVEPLKWSGSGDLVGFMAANSLIVIPEDQATVVPGQLVEIITLPS